MYQIQGKFLWGGEGWAGSGSIAEGGLNTTAVLGAIAVAISAINIAGGFAVTFRMLVRNHCPNHRSPHACLMVLFRRRCSPRAMMWPHRKLGTPRETRAQRFWAACVCGMKKITEAFLENHAISWLPSLPSYPGSPAPVMYSSPRHRVAEAFSRRVFHPTCRGRVMASQRKRGRLPARGGGAGPRGLARARPAGSSSCWALRAGVAAAFGVAEAAELRCTYKL